MVIETGERSSVARNICVSDSPASVPGTASASLIPVIRAGASGA